MKELSLDGNPCAMKDRIGFIKNAIKYLGYVKLIDGKTLGNLEEELGESK